MKENSICQNTLGRVQQRRDKQIVQSEGAKGWFEVQETTKGTRTLKNSRPINDWKRRMERHKENTFQIHCQRRPD